MPQYCSFCRSWFVPWRAVITPPFYQTQLEEFGRIILHDKQATTSKKWDTGKPFLTIVSSYSIVSQSLLSNASKDPTISSDPMDVTAL